MSSVLHVPPPVLLSVVVSPWHTAIVPVLADGRGLTVATIVVLHPVEIV
jgi:hypothetical protein